MSFDNVVYSVWVLLLHVLLLVSWLVTRHITVDGEVVNIPSYSVKPGQLIGVRERSKSLEVIANSLAGFNHSKYAWLEWDEASKGW